MSVKILYFRNLTQRDRHALILLRGGDSGRVAPEVAARFADLARNAQAAGLTIGEPSAFIVLEDEKRLLACLTLLQRKKDQAPSANCGLDPALMSALRDCAALLDGLGCRLDFRNVVHFGGEPTPASDPQANAAYPSLRAVAGSDPFKRTLQARVLQFVAEKGTVATHDLNAFGASSQVVSMMRKKGMLRRIRHGLYAAGQIERAAGSGGQRMEQLAPA